MSLRLAWDPDILTFLSSVSSSENYTKLINFRLPERSFNDPDGSLNVLLSMSSRNSREIMHNELE